MALQKVNKGDLITSTAWNNIIDEIDKKVNRDTDTMTGPLVITGGNWDVANTEGDFKIGDATNRLKIGVALGGGGAGDVRIFQSGASNRLLIGTGNNTELNLVNGRVGIKTAALSLELDVNGSAGVNSLRFNAASGNGMTISRAATELRVSMGFSGLIIIGGPPVPPLTYQFRIGHDQLIFGPGGGFAQRFAVNQAGDITASGSKGGYVADFFINKVGDSIEEGDVVIISKEKISRYYGTYSNIPIPEVDLTTIAYDTRVCGIVAKVVLESDLPPVELPPPTKEEIAKATAAAKSKRKSLEIEDEPAPVKATPHPYRKMGAQLSEDFDHRIVEQNQMGQMVTLGAFAHCKVDADIAAIKPGDLLTSSPTKGHAQKVLDPQKAIGAIIGKALAGLSKGQGKIPVMVFMQ